MFCAPDCFGWLLAKMEDNLSDSWGRVCPNSFWQCCEWEQTLPELYSESAAREDSSAAFVETSYRAFPDRDHCVVPTAFVGARKQQKCPVIIRR